MEVAHVAGRQRQGDNDEQGQGGDLDRHQDGVESGAFLGADDQQRGNENGDQHGRQVDDAADFATLDEAQRDGRPDRQGMGEMYPHIIEETDDMA